MPNHADIIKMHTRVQGLFHRVTHTLNEFLDVFEMAADWCENTADIIRAVSVRPC